MDKSADNHQKAHIIREKHIRSLDSFFYACSHKSITSSATEKPSSTKSDSMSQVLFCDSDRFFRHLKGRTINVDLIKTIIFTETEELIKDSMLDKFKLIVKYLPPTIQFVASFTIAPAYLVQDAENFLNTPQSYIRRIQKLRIRGTREFKIKMPEDRQEILLEISAASVHQQLVVFCNNYKTAENVLEGVKKTQPKAAIAYNAYDKDLYEMFDRGDLRILIGCENIAPCESIQRCKLLINYNQPLHEREYIVQIIYQHSGAILRAGNDSMLRAFSLNPDKSLGESQVIDAHTDSIQSIQHTKDVLITACEDGCVRSFDLSDNSFKELVVKSALAARWIGVENVRGKARRIALASDELIVKVVDLNDHLRVSLLQGHTKSVRSATWSPLGGVLATSSCDGSIKIWKEKNSQFECIKTIDGIIKADDPESEYGVAANWHPSDTENYKKIGSLSQDGHTSDVAELSWSPNGRYLASSGKDGYLIIWSIDDRRPISKTKCDALITSISWHPTENVLAFIDTSASASRWLKPIPEAAESPCLGKILYADETMAMQQQPSEEIDASKDDDLILKELEGDDGEDLDDFAIDDDEPLDKVVDKPRPGATVQFDPGQRPFQPGSTPQRLDRRYLAFNMLGVIHSVDQDTHNLVTVEFHDKSARRGYSFQDHFKSSLCALGEEGALYASTGNTSMIVYKPFDSWSSQQDWSTRLPDGESASILACGSKFVVVSTSKNYLRFFTTSGIQRYVINYGKDVVTASAGKQYFVAVSRSSGGASNGYQNLVYDVIDLSTFEYVQSGTVPLAKGVEITWLGFSSDIDIPLLGMDSQQGQLEESVMRDSLLLNHARDSNEEDEFEEEIKQHEIQIDKGILQLINTACKADKLQRALDAAAMLNQFTSIDAAMKIAAFFHLPSLQDRIYLLKEDKISQRERKQNTKKISYKDRVMSRPLSTMPISQTNQNSNTAPAFPARKPHMRRRFDAPVEDVDMDSIANETQEVVDVGNSVVDDDEPIAFSDDDDVDVEANAESSSSNKRKVDAIDDSQMTFSPPESSKIRLSNEALPPPPIPGMASQQPSMQANPFAKSANPFAKAPTDNSTTLKKASIHQSDSFFERADKPMNKKKAASKKQSSLLGHFKKPEEGGLHERDENSAIDSEEPREKTSTREKLEKFRAKNHTASQDQESEQVEPMEQVE
ncbi:WD40 repeat-like protein [Wallemia mellicola]|uniref:WD40 repeat-like protein n=1 Tax=Wallemia mellicola TaxID=1708541 RepID=A0A4V4N5F6_9BASI|nr:WD40 repeat-like protein [Wallemia mellicola]TIC22633.1 WD40 repeat-like protein [Wallemia mellicola]TIC24114.1 WD40 repeat-like protein [Wallemia mellicola]TIC72703.1 WD40 repeat-like protein [Wallemia mellicola]